MITLLLKMAFLFLGLVSQLHPSQVQVSPCFLPFFSFTEDGLSSREAREMEFVLGSHAPLRGYRGPAEGTAQRVEEGSPAR